MSPCRPVIFMMGLVLAALPGCHGLGQETRGQQDPSVRHDRPQPAGRDAKSLAVSVRDRAARRAGNHRRSRRCRSASASPFVVQADGFVDLGTSARFTSTGLTLAEAEERIADQVNDAARTKQPGYKEKYRVSVRLANSQSKYYYVLGTVANQGRFKAGGNDTVLDAIIQAGLEIQQPAREGLPGSAARSRRRGPGVQDRLVRHQGSRRHVDELPAFPR